MKLDVNRYAKLALFIGDKQKLSNASLRELTAQVNDDEEIAQSIIDVSLFYVYSLSV